MLIAHDIADDVLRYLPKDNLRNDVIYDILYDALKGHLNVAFAAGRVFERKNPLKN